MPGWAGHAADEVPHPLKIEAAPNFTTDHPPEQGGLALFLA